VGLILPGSETPIAHMTLLRAAVGRQRCPCWSVQIGGSRAVFMRPWITFREIPWPGRAGWPGMVRTQPSGAVRLRRLLHDAVVAAAGFGAAGAVAAEHLREVQTFCGMARTGADASRARARLCQRLPLA
jgi:hypothetical protein